jgi:ribose transport system substrate-binding protein
MKKIGVLLVCLLVVCSFFAGCTNTNPPSGESSSDVTAQQTASEQTVETTENGTEAIKVALSTFSLAIPWQIQTIDELQTAVDEYEGEIEFNIANADGNTADQITQLENFIDQKYDIILVDASSATGLNPTLATAKEAGIVVISYNCIVDDPSAVTSRVYVDQKEWGKIMAQFLVDEIGTGNVVCLTGLSGNQIAADRWEGAQEVFAANPNIKVLADAPAEWEQSLAEEKMQAWVTAFPEIDGVWADGGPSAVGVINVLEKNNMDMIPVSGEAMHGMIKVWHDQIANGLTCCAPVCPVYIGRIAFNAGIKALNGETVPADVVIDIPVMTNDNIDEWYDADASDEQFAFDKITQEEIDAYFN